LNILVEAELKRGGLRNRTNQKGVGGLDQGTTDSLQDLKEYVSTIMQF
jgi:hypothetical protein